MASTLNNKKYNIAITGANGFIGKHLTQKLLENKHNIKVLVRRKTFDHIENENLEEIISKGGGNNLSDNCLVKFEDITYKVIGIIYDGKI